MRSIPGMAEFVTTRGTRVLVRAAKLRAMEETNSGTFLIASDFSAYHVQESFDEVVAACRSALGCKKEEVCTVFHHGSEGSAQSTVRKTMNGEKVTS